MLANIIYSVILLHYAGCLPPGEPNSGPAEDLAPHEASQIAETFVEAGLEGFTLLRINDSDEDIDSCNFIRTSTYEVQLKSTGEVFEITTESNITNARNCRHKNKLMQAVSQGGITRVQRSGKTANDSLIWEEMQIAQFQEELSMIVQEDFRIVTANQSLSFAEDNDAKLVLELTELQIQMINSTRKYVVNFEGEVDFFGSVMTRRKPYPPKVLLSLLGGGSFSKIKRKS